jgi:cytochrome b pre-mRNA-processing protein 3
MLGKLFTKQPEKRVAASLHAAIIRAARSPDLYGDAGVPDTLEGRFELVLLHVGLVIHRLRSDNSEQSKQVSQFLFDAMFDDFDIAMRELGVGDSGVGKKIRFMAEGFYGRTQGYIDALAETTNDELAAVISRNLLGIDDGDERAVRLATYVRCAYDSLLKQGPLALVQGEDPQFATA